MICSNRVSTINNTEKGFTKMARNHRYWNNNKYVSLTNGKT